MTYEFLGL
jgi:hypothetical protein